ncbi:glycosyltransferase [Oleiharenicola lentus]|uniref:Glycosyltransferase n=1 Tax=Oleiharenicola lentus TaxID=2508720 RepID=A0A4Q1C3J6_9BACT|nr:glycosyltransferase [Oleiharenicola lentus]RXK52910.1 glycosyltransferase [Oleiharenicola lentus]
MLHRRLYYLLKPFLPWSLRMGFRRILARRLRRIHSAVWPIQANAATKPTGWPGWPENSQFAFVITHDVEGPEGLAKCRQLAELEMEMGVRSCFNFIPEGPYAVPPELRAWLVGNGFEVGVHDLRHDGHLYDSRRGFEEQAVRINHHLQDWGASGFRAGFMLRNLEWLHDLKIEYDSSTFDTDPFEPQSSGAGTIFPFWVSAPPPRTVSANGRYLTPPPNTSGYIELPYTLPQDSTLFLLLRETSPEIWLRKLDWVAGHGGMALVNVHPDYVRFDGEAASPRTFPVSYYRELLAHVRRQHTGRYWQALPGQVSRFARGLSPLPALPRPRRICMISHSFYESDNRVTRYAEALAARGDHVDILALRRSADLPRQETIQNVCVHRLQDRFGKNEQSKLSYLWPLLRFLLASFWWLTRSHARRRYDLIHVHNIPDFLIFAALYPKMTGTPVILDIHDIVPEFFTSKFGQRASGVSFTLLKLMERCSAALANHVIIANHLWLDTYTGRTGTRDRSTAFINYVDSQVFVPAPAPRDDGKKVVIFPGGLQWHQGLDIAIRAFPAVRAAVPGAEFHIYGDGNAKESLVALTRDLGLDGCVRFFEPTNVRKVAAIMARADLGVVPKRADSFGNEAYSTKIMEFMSVGVPAVVSSTKIDRYYFDDTVVRFFPSGNVEALVAALISLLSDAELHRRQAAAGLEYARLNCWETRKHDYLGLVDRLSPFC